MEREIEKLIEVLKKMSDGTARGSTITGALAGKSAKDQKEFQKQLEKTIESMKKKKKLDEDEIKNLKDINREFDNAEESIADFSGAMDRATNAAGPFVKTIFKLGDGAAKADNDLATLAGMFDKFGLAGDVVQALAGSLDYNMQVFRELSQVGASFGKSLIAMREAAHAAMLPLSEFAGVVADNAMSLSALFGTTEQGIKNIGAFSLAIRDKALKDGLFNLGVTTEELNEYMGTYLERQRFADQREILTAAQVADRTAKYTKQLDLLAKVTGIQRKQIDDAVKDQQKDALLQRALTGLTADQKDAANLFLGTLRNISPALADNAKILMETGVPFDEFGEKLIGTNGEIGNILINFEDLLRQGKSVPEILGMMSKAGEGFIDGFDQGTIAFGGLGDVADAIQQIVALQIDETAAISEQNKKAKELLETLAPFNEEMRRLKVAFAEIQTEFLRGLTPAITAFTEFITGDFKGYIEKLIEMIKGFDPKKFGKALMLALAGTLILDFAKQVSIVALGTAAGMRGLGFGARSLGGKALGAVGKAGGVGLGVGGAYMAGEYGAGADTHLKKGAGIAGSAASGAIAGAMFGPIGAAVGGLLGGIYGAYKSYNKDAEKATKAFDQGTMGTGPLFQDFGSGTPAMLHGMEAVVTPGQLAKLMAMGPARYLPGRKITDFMAERAPAIFKDFGDSMEALKDKITLTGGRDGDESLLLAINNLQKTLNTSNMIASMIERNTKSTNNNLANMTGTLV